MDTLITAHARNMLNDISGYDASCKQIYDWVKDGMIDHKQMATLLVEIYKQYIY